MELAEYGRFHYECNSMLTSDVEGIKDQISQTIPDSPHFLPLSPHTPGIDMGQIRPQTSELGRPGMESESDIILSPFAAGNHCMFSVLPASHIPRFAFLIILIQMDLFWMRWQCIS